MALAFGSEFFAKKARGLVFIPDVKQYHNAKGLYGSTEVNVILMPDYEIC